MSECGTEHRVREPGFDGRVREFTKSGWKEDVEMLAVEEFVTHQHGTLDGGPPAEVQHSQKRTEIQEKHAYGVMVALADYLGYEVVER